MKNGIRFGQELRLIISPNQDDDVIFEQEGDTYTYKYSKDWLLESLDNPSILNNFIYLFEYTDAQMRCQHVTKQSLIGVFEMLTIKNTEKDYPCSMGFDLINALANMQMELYYNFLFNNKIHLEDVLTWFFTTYLQEEFNCPKIRAVFPSKDSTYYEKCCLIATTFDNVLKQFTKYVENGEIDFELINMSTKPILFGNVPSLIKDKYVYGFGRDYKDLTNLLFSDQCMMTYIPRIYSANKEYSCFFELLKKEDVYMNDIDEYYKPSIEYLRKYDILHITDEEKIELKNLLKINILHDLYRNGVISKWRYSNKAHTVMKNMEDDGILVVKSTLLSEPEINYFNYMLNRKEYRNSLEIRNKYLHGNQQTNENEQEHMQNYYILLRMFIILVIKINDDFCLNEKKNAEEYQNG